MEVSVAWSRVVAFLVLGSGRARIVARLIVGVRVKVATAVESLGTLMGVAWDKVIFSASPGKGEAVETLKPFFGQGVGTQVVDLIQEHILPPPQVTHPSSPSELEPAQHLAMLLEDRPKLDESMEEAMMQGGKGVRAFEIGMMLWMVFLLRRRTVKRKLDPG